jgi:glucose-6-phosphate isomerase
MRAMMGAEVAELHAGSGVVDSNVSAALQRLDAARVIERIWAKDHTVWNEQPNEIADRLGWLTMHRDIVPRIEELNQLVASVRTDAFDTALVLGMGGSSLAAEVFRNTIGVSADGLRLEVLDSTHPDEIRALESRINLATTLFVVSSKSGGTIETRGHFDYFWEKSPDGRHFVVITDEGSALESLAIERGVQAIFRNPTDVGGRFSALSLFGLVPAALMGIDVQALLGSAGMMASLCEKHVAWENPGALLGAVIAEAALAGRDKMTVVLPEEMDSFGNWIEQLVAESTGKAGLGIVPVVGEQPLSPDAYGEDRLFVVYGDNDRGKGLIDHGRPVVVLPEFGATGLGAEIFRWEFATAVAGHLLSINPFDQPNVQEAKDATAIVLSSGVGISEPGAIVSVLASIQPGDYIALLCFVPRNEANVERAQRIRLLLGQRFGVATTVGFGPRYLHGPGQLHKGGPNRGVFLQIVEPALFDLPIPGQAFSFGQLNMAQAAGDADSLLKHDRRLWRGTMDELVSALA